MPKKQSELVRNTRSFFERGHEKYPPPYFLVYQKSTDVMMIRWRVKTNTRGGVCLGKFDSAEEVKQFLLMNFPDYPLEHVRYTNSNNFVGNKLSREENQRLWRENVGTMVQTSGEAHPAHGHYVSPATRMFYAKQKSGKRIIRNLALNQMRFISPSTPLPEGWEYGRLPSRLRLKKLWLEDRIRRARHGRSDDEDEYKNN